MISVIIPTYGRPEKVVSAIESVCNQTYKNIEIVVVDDNGVGTEMQILTQNNVSLVNDKRIKYIPHTLNKGGCTARNTGVYNSNGEFVAFLDDDDVWSNCFLEKMMTFFQDKNIGAVYCDFYSFDGYVSTTLKEPRFFEGDVFEQLLKGWCPASTSLFLLRKSFFQAVGGFDKKLPSFQDYDMWLRLSKICSFAYCPEKLVLKYEGIGEQTSRNPIKRLNGYYDIIKKHEKELNSQEKELFKEFKDRFYYDTMYRCFRYYKEKKEPYKQFLKEYIKKYDNYIKRIFYYLGLSSGVLNSKCLRKRRLKKNKQLILYKGAFPV